MWPDVAFLSEKSLIAGCWSSRRREEGNSRPKSRGRSVPRCLLACHVCFVLTRSCVQEKALARTATWTAACQNFNIRRRPSAQLRGRIMVVGGKGGRRGGGGGNAARHHVLPRPRPGQQGGVGNEDWARVRWQWAAANTSAVVSDGQGASYVVRGGVWVTRRCALVRTRSGRTKSSQAWAL